MQFIFTRSARMRRRTVATVSATVLAAGALLASSVSADAVVTAGGARNADGTPGLIRDDHGLAMQLCVDATNCEPADPAAGDIGQYFSAEAALGPMRAIWGLDAAFLEDAAGNLTDRAAVTNAALFRAEGLRPNSRYTIKGPWGTHRCSTNVDGALDNKNCLFVGGGEAGGTIGSGPVKSFLFAQIHPAGFLGNLTVPQRVVGSPTGFNRVTLDGPGAHFSTNRFVLGGQMVENQPMALVGQGAENQKIRLGSKRNTRVVTKTLRYRSVGTAAANPQIRKAGRDPGAFKLTKTNCGAVAPRQSCQIQISYTPRRADKHAVLVITDNTLAGPRRVSLTGVAPTR